MPPSQASNLVYAAVALLASLLLIIQLPIHFQPTKSSNWLFILWVALALLNSAINAIVWNDNTVNWTPAWCDISSNIILASRLGIPLGLLCIARRIHGAISGKVIYQAANKERHGMLWDMFIAIGIPLLFLPLTYIAEGNDFSIGEQEGCYPMIPLTAPAIVLYVVPPTTIALISAIYSALTVYIILRRRAQAHQFKFEDVGNRIDNYELRLTLLASAEIGFMLPLAIFRMVLNMIPNSILPFNWNYIHSDFSYIPMFPISVWAGGSTARLMAFELLEHWILVGYTILFLAFFGWTQRARNHYKRYYVPAFFGDIIRRFFGYHGESAADQSPQKTNLDLERSSHRRATGLVFRSFLTSFGASHFTSSQTTSADNPHIYSEEISSGPKFPALIHLTAAHGQEKDQSYVNDPHVLQIPHVSIAAPLTHTSDNVPPLVFQPKPVFLRRNVP